MLKRTRVYNPCDAEAEGDCNECETPPRDGPRCSAMCKGVRCMRRCVDGTNMCIQHQRATTKASERESHSARRRAEPTLAEVLRLEDPHFLGLEVRESTIPNAGNGMFATKRLPIHTLLGAYRGEMIDHSELMRRYPNGHGAYVYSPAGGIYIDAANPLKSNHMRYINSPHGTRNQSNCTFSGSFVVTTKNINAGSELFLNYGHKFFRSDVYIPSPMVDPSPLTVAFLEEEEKVDDVVMTPAPKVANNFELTADFLEADEVRFDVLTEEEPVEEENVASVAPFRKSPRKVTQKELQMRFEQTCQEFETHVIIQKSSVAPGGFGAFTKRAVRRGEFIGYYAGRNIARASLDEGYHPMYKWSPIDAYDAHGVLVTEDGRHITGLEIERISASDRIATRGRWRGSLDEYRGRLVQNSNWTRFMNHVSGAFLNVSVGMKGKFGHGIVFYANCNIPAGAELFVSYGNDYFSNLKIKPVNPTIAGTRYVFMEQDAKTFAIDTSLLALDSPLMNDIDFCDAEEVFEDCDKCVRDASSVKPQCTAECKSGQRCRRNALEDALTCRQHKNS